MQVLFIADLFLVLFLPLFLLYFISAREIFPGAERRAIVSKTPCPTAKVELSVPERQTPHIAMEICCFACTYVRTCTHTVRIQTYTYPTLDRDGDTEGRLLPESSPRGCTAAGRYVTDVALSTSRCLSLPGILSSQGLVILISRVPGLAHVWWKVK